MNAWKEKVLGFLSKNYGFFILAVILFWLKSYIAYNVAFNLGIENPMQQFLLLINPLSSAVFFMGLALFAKGRRSFVWIIVIDFILSFGLYANAVYYRFFSDFITLPNIREIGSLGEQSGSLGALMHWSDILYFADILFLIALLVFRIVKPSKEARIRARKTVGVLTLGVAMFFANLGLAEIDRPELLTRTFDRTYIVKYLGMTNFQIYDAVKSTQNSTQRALADSSDVNAVLNYTKSNYAQPNPEYFGKAKGKNVIYIHLESFQQFLIGYKLHGQEVTPFINSFFKDKNTISFTNFFHQTGQGKTSDAEMMLENSLFGLPQGSAFSTKGKNTYQSAPAILGQQGYDSAVFHGNYKSFWNRDEIYKQFGYNHFFDASYYDMNEKDVSNYGLKDKPFFLESEKYLQTLKQPFYAKFITLTNHFPYPIAADEATIQPADTGDASVDTYFQTARYLDEAVKSFVQYLKDSGLYDNTVIVMYGDHYGISDNHAQAMSKVLGTDYDAYQNAQAQRVPFMIRVPGVEGGVKDTYGGEIDVLPTLLHLLGTDTKNYVQLGSDLLSKDVKQVVPFRNGDFITPAYSMIGGKFYNQKTGEEITTTTDEMKATKDNVAKELELSDEVLQGDLLRFYTPEGFKKTDPSKYNYNNKNKSTTTDKSSTDEATTEN
ncbi:LTA synthase family protein [Listeria booriae]|uniref:LTA synthase family protein n=1 Tax=Listeria booriae TaxID=1552123 RepID=A0A841YJV1_9LIST|nr:LTA synthase family protein [Listeria booriae]MBC1291865.1 LTA synthase family protein [Listeria booriae]MBC1334119.1 LTA synthase family protein [Listeria booriae]MBC1400473.1 LTA synthase family protein [Listeria booriae]MBC1512545.1 LTA synthase family protein [Listeria booriae]MBC1615801.1 LTA synthase family protein [Listeria booriae]